MKNLLRATRIGAICGAMLFWLAPAVRIAGNPFAVGGALLGMYFYYLIISKMVVSWYGLQKPPFDESAKNLFMHFLNAFLFPVAISSSMYGYFH